MSGNEVWIVKGAVGVFSTKEDAEVLAEFLRGKSPTNANGNQIFPVKKVYMDCYVNKIKKGYNIFEVQMERNGNVVCAKESFKFAPTEYGFRRRTFMMSAKKEAGKTVYSRIMAFWCLAKDKEEAIALAEKERVKTVLDDIWKFKNGSYYVDEKTMMGGFLP